MKHQPHRPLLALLTALAWVLVAATVPVQPAGAAEDLAARVILDAEAQGRAGLAFESVRLDTLGNPLPVIGRIVRAPGATVEVRSILEGRVEALYAAPGTRVAAGDRLLTLHSHGLHQLQGELLEANESLRLAENRVAAGHELYALEGISRLDLEHRQQEALRARIALDSVAAELEDLGFRKPEIDALIANAEPHPTLTVRAPADGVVLALAVEQHAWVQRYEDLMTIGDPQRLELELQIPPSEAPTVVPGDQVSFAPVGQPERDAVAEIITPVPTVDPLTRTVTIRARIVEGLGRLLPGVYVEGILERGQGSSVVTVPESAVIRIDGKDHVFVRIDDQTFEARPIALGRYGAARYEIRTGLEVGEEVARAGVFLLKSALIRGLEE